MTFATGWHPGAVGALWRYLLRIFPMVADVSVDKYDGIPGSVDREDLLPEDIKEMMGY